MKGAILSLPAGATVRLTSPKGYFAGAYTLSEAFRSFGVAWQSCAALVGDGSPVLFFSEYAPPVGSNIGKGYTLRVDVDGAPTFYPVTVAPVLSDSEVADRYCSSHAAIDPGGE